MKKSSIRGLSSLLLTLTFALVTGAATAGENGRSNAFEWRNLVSDIPGVATRTDGHLVNPWGIARSPSGPIWISDNGAGVSTVYDEGGRSLPNSAQPLVVNIPAAPGNTEGAVPTGIVFNNTSDFTISANGKSAGALFIFAGEDGTISAWNPTVDKTNAVLAADLSGSGAVYKGIAMGSSNSSNYLYATNFSAGTVDIFDRNFTQVIIPGAFVDPQLDPGFAPFGIANIDGLIYVTYALQDSGKEDDVAGAGNGFIDVYTTNGTFVKRFASHGSLNSPWGLTMAPKGFGKFNKTLLVGNFGDGRINVYNSVTGSFLGQLQNREGDPLAFQGLWGLLADDFKLYFTAGIADEGHGIFGVIARGMGFNSD